MRITRNLAVFGLCSALTLVSSARAGDVEEDEGPVVKSTSVGDALVMLGRGREDRAWAILGDTANLAEAKKAALKGLKQEEPFALRGSALYLGTSKVWGKGKDVDHPRWREPLEKRLAKARKALDEIKAALGTKNTPKARQVLLRRRKKARDQEEILLEVLGHLGNKASWKELGKQVESATSSHTIRGAARGLTGPRGNGLQRLTKILADFEKSNAKLPKQPPPAERIELVQDELKRVARTSQALKLVASVDRNPSAAGLAALERLVSKKALKEAWRTVERAGRSRSAAVRAAAASVVPKLRGQKSKVEFLVGLLRDDSEIPVRVAAASAMGRLSRREAAPYLTDLIEALKDEVVVREAAGKALVQLTGHKMGPVHKAWERWLARQ